MFRYTLFIHFDDMYFWTEGVVQQCCINQIINAAVVTRTHLRAYKSDTCRMRMYKEEKVEDRCQDYLSVD